MLSMFRLLTKHLSVRTWYHISIHVSALYTLVHRQAIATITAAGSSKTKATNTSQHLRTLHVLYNIFAYRYNARQQQRVDFQIINASSANSESAHLVYNLYETYNVPEAHFLSKPAPLPGVAE